MLFFAFVIGIVAADADCTPDYSSSCPSGWNLVEGSKCIASLSYSGPCSMVMAVNGLDERRKQSLADKCGVTWPCSEQCAADYDGNVCPQGWIERPNSLCDAPYTYSGPCASTVHMLDSEFKADFAANCDVSWPCKTCEQDFSQPCPTSWDMVGGVCAARASAKYTGPCLPFQNLVDLSAKEKELLAGLCFIEFCAAVEEITEARSTHGDQCTICPKGWLLVGTLVEHCLSLDYNGPCRPVIAVAELGQIGKRIFADTCGVDFSCEPLSKAVVKDIREVSSDTGNSVSGDLSGPIANDGRFHVLTH